MSAMLRHSAMRLWLTALVGGALCLWLLPWWQRAAGIQWLAVPSLAVLAACFLVLGRGMNYVGMWIIRRHLKEAQVWNQAGMHTEARTALQKGVALFDSFWLSPLLRRRKSVWFRGTLARFYLGPSSGGAYARGVVADYLVRNPEDADLARPWLEQLSIYPQHLREEHEAAARVGAALAAHPAIQKLLMHFYIAVGRMDFDARQTCRRVWQSGQSLSRELVRRLGRLLLEARALGPWALKVYLKAHEAGEEGALEGLAACARYMRPTEDSRSDLAAAKARLADADDDLVNRALAMTQGFEPPAVIQRPPRQRPAKRRPPKAPIDLVTPVTTAIHGAGRRMAAMARPDAAGIWLKRLAVAAAVVGVVVIVARWRMQPPPQKQPPPPEVAATPAVPVITDPFTIQVAAYVSQAEAQRFVEQLAEKGLDAFWTRATSANRTWYQVKVSHFANKAAAQSYGNELKSKGLIDDFYVANYEPPAAKSQ